MKFSYNWLQEFFNRNLPSPKNLAELLTDHFAEVEEIKKEGKDFSFEIDVRPNRAGDCFSHFGIAREIAAITKVKINEVKTSPARQKSKINENKESKAIDFICVEIKDKHTCQRYTARAIADVKINVSPKWIQEKLKVCGLRPINNIVDIANYVMLETGQPLHAFDLDKLEGRRIIVRFGKSGEKVTTLDGEHYNLDEDILVIADEKKPIGIAGIKGEKFSGISKSTKVIVLEAANFKQKIIRRGSQKLRLKTDASLRFEHGIDPNLTETAINRAVFLIQEIAGGRAAKGLIDYYPKKVLPKRIKLNLDYVESLLGVKISLKKIINILKKLQFQCAEAGPRHIMVGVPTFRLDINLPEDLIEEIGRIYDYNKIPAVFPVTALMPAKRNLDIFWENIAKNVLKEAGFTEVYNYSFIGENDSKIFSFKKKALIEIENPISSEQRYLRPSLIPNLLKNVRNNAKNFGEIEIFELGKVFRKNSNSKEKKQLSGVITGDNFYQAKGIVNLLSQKLGISNIWYNEYKPTPEESKMALWHQKKAAKIKINSKEIGFLGEISSKVLADFKISSKMVVFDIDFEKLANLATEEKEYRPISKFPAAVRDLAILVPREVRIKEVLNKIETAGGSLVRDIDLFDIYEGEELPEGKKNLAFHIIYQAEDRTLAATEIDKIQNKIIQALEKEIEWEVRK